MHEAQQRELFVHLTPRRRKIRYEIVAAKATDPVVVRSRMSCCHNCTNRRRHLRRVIRYRQGSPEHRKLSRYPRFHLLEQGVDGCAIHRNLVPAMVDSHLPINKPGSM